MTNWTYQVFVDSTFNPPEGDMGHAFIKLTDPTINGVGLD